MDNPSTCHDLKTEDIVYKYILIVPLMPARTLYQVDKRLNRVNAVELASQIQLVHPMVEFIENVHRGSSVDFDFRVLAYIPCHIGYQGCTGFSTMEIQMSCHHSSYKIFLGGVAECPQRVIVDEGEASVGKEDSWWEYPRDRLLEWMDATLLRIHSKIFPHRFVSGKISYAFTIDLVAQFFREFLMDKLPVDTNELDGIVEELVVIGLPD